MSLKAKHTVGASYLGYMTQALTMNFAPLLFVTFQNSYGISLSKISLLIAISFITQLSVDAFEAKFASKLNTRTSIVTGHIFAALGLISYAFLPDLLPNPYAGLVAATVMCGIGGGTIEVLISPIVEACPTRSKSSAMSLLHSFYCWGTAGAILLSTLFFVIFGVENWKILSCIWAIVPIIGALLFTKVPIYQLEADTEQGKAKAHGASLARSPLFWMFVVMMFCSGAAEMAMIQWASSFAEEGLGVSKTVGDLLGPCSFALFMGATRVAYALSNKKLKLPVCMALSAILCIISYLTAAISSVPLLSLAGCALCGMSVALLWPGTYSLATKNIKFGGVRMFALLALAGDVGCTVGPSAVGFVAEMFGGNLKISFLLSTVFPVTVLALIPFIMLSVRKQKNKSEN